MLSRCNFPPVSGSIHLTQSPKTRHTLSAKNSPIQLSGENRSALKTYLSIMLSHALQWPRLWTSFTKMRCAHTQAQKLATSAACLHRECDVFPAFQIRLIVADRGTVNWKQPNRSKKAWMRNALFGVSFTVQKFWMTQTFTRRSNATKQPDFTSTPEWRHAAKSWANPQKLVLASSSQSCKCHLPIVFTCNYTNNDICFTTFTYHFYCSIHYVSHNGKGICRVEMM